MRGYLQAALFILLGVRSIQTWIRTHDRRSEHLALATALFGINSLISAISATVWDATRGEIQPRAVQIISGIIIYLAIYGFLLFLNDFMSFPAILKALLVVATVFNVVMAIIEQPGIALRNGRIVTLDVNNPIPYRAYLWYLLGFLAVAFAVLGFSFLLYGSRTHGLARLRMILIGSGFTVLFVAIGLIPLLLFGNPSAAFISRLSDIVRYMALASAPLLYIGFVPPKALTTRFTEAQVPAGA